MVDQETKAAAQKRLRRKLEIMKLDFRNLNHSKYYDVVECIALLNMIEEDDEYERKKTVRED